MGIGRASENVQSSDLDGKDTGVSCGAPVTTVNGFTSETCSGPHQDLNGLSLCLKLGSRDIV
jgi:hypothetical protein